MGNDRFVIVADSLNGGLGLAAISHAKHLRDQGKEVWLFSTATLSPDYSNYGINSVKLPIPVDGRKIKILLICAASIRRNIKMIGPCGVYAHGARSGVIILLARSRPTLVNHISPAEAVGPRAWLRRRLYSVLPILARHAVSARNSSSAGWIFVPHASPLLESLSPAAPVEMSCKPTFLWLGRLAEPKQPEVFVKALAIVNNTRAGAEIVGIIAGDGPMRSQLEIQARDTNAPVTFVGDIPADRLKTQIATSWAICLVSKSEAIPFSLQEGMWSSRAIITSDLPGTRWLAGNAAVYTASRPEDLARAMTKLVDRDYAVALGEKAAVRVRSKIWPGMQYSSLDSLS